MSEYLFVYGTLRREYGLDLMREIADWLVYIAEGRIKAALYDLGLYPAAVAEGEGSKEITGDVYQLTDSKTIFAVLDEYEGEDFRRGLTVVKMKTGEEKEAFVYWYTGQTEKALLIEEGDYLTYVKNKNPTRI